MLFLNTDVFLRFLTETGTPEAAAARAVFSTMEAGKQKVTSSPVVLYELITTLHNPQGYNQPKERIAASLSLLLGLRAFHLDDKQLWQDVFTTWTKEPIDFIEAYNAVFMKARGAVTL